MEVARWLTMAHPGDPSLAPRTQSPEANNLLKLPPGLKCMAWQENVLKPKWKTLKIFEEKGMGQL